MAEVTYLLGAGASANRVPIVNKMSSSIYTVISELQKYIGIINDSLFVPSIELKDDVKKQIPQLLEDLQWMAYSNAAHSSIDTFAKKLYLTKSKDLNKLKLILSFYFTYLQITGEPDQRYDNFWASILTRPELLPKKIKILSWNYDFQLEQSYANISNQNTLHYAREWICLFNYLGQNYSLEDTGFGIIKLNGSAEVHASTDSGKQEMYNENINGAYGSKLESLISRYTLFKTQDNITPLLRFAWESNPINLEKMIIRFVEKTEVLAIIGYSLPFFNRKIDKMLFQNMPSLRTIYIQDSYPDVIKERLEEIIDLSPYVEKPIKLYKVTDLGQFVFPKELEV